ncbi:transmembrane protein 116-like [Amphiura filiformis]|uniref:transmembrane protein 116-like n=1 Tax=Amphiura filiformis TaxID=82378 RepID=UPI003B2119E0
MGNRTDKNITDEILDKDEREIVRIAEFISCSLSILGAGSIICIAIWKKKVFRPEVHPLFHLSMADLLAAVFVITGLSIYGYDNDEAPYVCYWVTGLAVGLYLSTFMLTFVYALEAYVRTKEQLSERRQPAYDNDREPINVCTPWYMGLAYTIAWALPIFMVIGVVLPTQRISSSMPPICTRYHYGCLVMFHQSKDPCLDRTQDAINARLALKSFFLFVLLAVSTGLFVLYSLTHKTLRRIHNLQGVIGPRQYDEARRVRNRGILYCSVFIICWLPALIIGLMSYSSIDIRNMFWLYLLQSIMSPLQGFLNCVIYGWIRGSFQRALNLGADSTLLSWSVRRRVSPAIDSARYTDYGTLSNTDDDYEGQTSGRESDKNRNKTFRLPRNTQNDIVLSTSESAAE